MTLTHLISAALLTVLVGCTAFGTSPIEIVSVDQNGQRPHGDRGVAAGGSGSTQADTAAPALAPLSLADSDTPAYVRIQPEQTGVISAADDGYDTFIGLASPPPAALEVFDSNGQLLQVFRRGRLIAVPGTHMGILLRAGSANSYVAPNPNPGVGVPFPLDRDPDVVALRNELRGVSSQLDAFREALRKADLASSSGQTVRAPSLPATNANRIRQRAGSVDVEAGPVSSPSTAIPIPQERSALAAGSTPIAMTTIGTESRPAPRFTMNPALEFEDSPKILANGQILMRVFFASGGRTVVRPDDGLLRLEQQARQADIIRVRGFTDSIGDSAMNDVLAQQRAEGIATFLIARGVPRERIVVESRGATEFIAENTSPQGRALNRRVEVMFGNPDPGKP